jgi:hypothetical protein
LNLAEKDEHRILLKVDSAENGGVRVASLILKNVFEPQGIEPRSIEAQSVAWKIRDVHL